MVKWFCCNSWNTESEVVAVRYSTNGTTVVSPTANGKTDWKNAEVIEREEDLLKQNPTKETQKPVEKEGREKKERNRQDSVFIDGVECPVIRGKTHFWRKR